MPIDPEIKETLERISKRLDEPQNATAQSDALAWGIIALETAGEDSEKLDALRRRLVEFQMGDGRFTLLRGAFEVFWPTPAVLIALANSSAFEENKSRGIEFLLRIKGKHWKKSPDAPAKHDTSIEGWPWVVATHSWVIPTAMAIIALRIYRYAGHERVREGVRMLLDRQLPTGGWNYGNTVVFKSTLRPIPECTGFALSALHGLADERLVEKSINYLSREAATIRTPLSLSWAVMGLGAWSRGLAQRKEWIVETLGKQEMYGEFPVSLLAQLVVSYYSDSGPVALFQKDGGNG